MNYSTLLFSLLFITISNGRMQDPIIGKWRVIDYNTDLRASSKNLPAIALMGLQNFPARFIFTDNRIKIENKKGNELDEGVFEIKNNQMFIQCGDSKVVYSMIFSQKKDTLSLLYDSSSYVLKREK
jgi:hypothetical protein